MIPLHILGVKLQGKEIEYSARAGGIPDGRKLMEEFIHIFKLN